MSLESWLEACGFCKYLLLGVKNVVDIKIHMVSSDNTLSALNSINKVSRNMSDTRSLLPIFLLEILSPWMTV